MPGVQGVEVSALDVERLLDRVGGWVDSRSTVTVSYVNAHVLNVAAKDEELSYFLAYLDLCYCDGLGVVLGARILGHQLPRRMTGADWIEDLANRAAREEWRLGWVAGRSGVVDEAVQRLQARHPGLRFPVQSQGYFVAGSKEEEELLRAVKDARLDILLVGMGTPTQEAWVRRLRERLDVPVVWCVGATADFVAGRVSRGPRWLHENQEWLARLIVEPRRLWRRYLLGNPRFLLRMVRHRLRR